MPINNRKICSQYEHHEHREQCEQCEHHEHHELRSVMIDYNQVIGYYHNAIGGTCDLAWKIFGKIIAEKPDHVIEIGTQFGKSALLYSLALYYNSESPELHHKLNMIQGTGIKYGKLHCIDPHYTHEVLNTDFLAMLKVFPQLASFINYKQIESQKAFSEFINETVDIIIQDGRHTYEGVFEDLNLYFPKLKQGGTIYIHDNWEPIDRAVKKFVKKNKLKNNFLQFSNNLGWYEIYKK